MVCHRHILGGHGERGLATALFTFNLAMIPSMQKAVFSIQWLYHTQRNGPAGNKWVIIQTSFCRDPACSSSSTGIYLNHSSPNILPLLTWISFPDASVPHLHLPLAHQLPHFPRVLLHSLLQLHSPTHHHLTYRRFYSELFASIVISSY